MSIHEYTIAAIPDATDHRLVLLCGGNVHAAVFKGFEQVLRIVAQFAEGRLALSLRYAFEPGPGRARQERLRMSVALRLAPPLSPDVATQLVDVGPLSDFFEFQACGARPSCPSAVPEAELDLRGFPCLCEILRQEDRVDAQVPRELNKFVPSSGFYYSPVLLVPRENNDYLALDSLLSRLTEACSVEFLVAPVDPRPERAAHEKYLRQLTAINGYGDDVFISAALEKGALGPVFGGSALEAPPLQGIRRRDPTADDILREQQEFHRALRQPQLLFNARVFACRPETALMVASTVAECAFLEGKYRIVSYDAGSGETVASWLAESIRQTRQMEVSLHTRNCEIWDRALPEAWRSFERMGHLATVDELKGLFRLPVGGSGSPRCMRKCTDPQPSARGVRKSILIGDDLESERPPARSVNTASLEQLFLGRDCDLLELRLPTETLAKHQFVSGVPGSGKTTAVFNQLVQLFGQGIPFLVLEPAKTEYRILKTLTDHPDPLVRRMAGEIRVYTPGNEEVSPLRFNPLAFPEGITLDEHIGQVLACFEAAMPMGGPLQALIAEAVEAVYQGREDGSFPVMDDLTQAARRIMQEKGYDGEIRGNLQAAIEVRLGLLTRRAMGRLFRSARSIPPIDELVSCPTILEMDYLPQSHACLLSLFILSAVREHIRTRPERRKGGLQHVTVVEEAHNIVGRTREAGNTEEGTDPRAFAAQYVSRMLAELRALGEGILIADQLPSTVAAEVVKNTGTKIAHRLVSKEDREELGASMVMSEVETEQLARLTPGCAYLYTEGLYRPRRVRCLDSGSYLCLREKTLPVGAELVPHLQNDAWFQQGMEDRAMGALESLFSRTREMEERLEQAGQSFEFPGVADRVAAAKREPDWNKRLEQLVAIQEELRAQSRELREAFEGDYLARSVRCEVPGLEHAATRSDHVRDDLARFVELHNEHLEPRYQAVMARIAQAQEGIAAELELCWKRPAP